MYEVAAEVSVKYNLSCCKGKKRPSVMADVFVVVMVLLVLLCSPVVGALFFYDGGNRHHP